MKEIFNNSFLKFSEIYETSDPLLTFMAFMIYSACLPPNILYQKTNKYIHIYIYIYIKTSLISIVLCFNQNKTFLKRVNYPIWWNMAKNSSSSYTTLIEKGVRMQCPSFVDHKGVMRLPKVIEIQLRHQNRRRNIAYMMFKNKIFYSCSSFAFIFFTKTSI